MSAVAPTTPTHHLPAPPAATLAVTGAVAAVVLLVVVLLLAPWRDTAPSTVPAQVDGGGAAPACEVLPVSPC